MNRHFFADGDTDGMRNRALEVEVLKKFLKDTFPKESSRFAMFLDIHAHSAACSIFIYSPNPENDKDLPYVKRLPTLLDINSPYFMLSNCKWANEKSKRNCARLSVYRDFGLLDSYTIESSCWGYEVKGTGKNAEGPDIKQFSTGQFLEFGEQLLISICSHRNVEINDIDRAGMCTGFEIEREFALGLNESPIEPRIKAKGSKKSLNVIVNRSDSVSKHSTKTDEGTFDDDIKRGFDHASYIQRNM